MQPDTIDFLRGDIGPWFLLVIIPLVAVLKLKGLNSKQAGWREFSQAIAGRLLIGLLIATPITAFLLVWPGLRSDYFIKLRVESERVVLSYPRPDREIAIPVNDLKNIQIIKSGGGRSSCSRVRIQTGTGVHQSYGFNKLNEDEVAVMDKLRTRVGPRVFVPNQ